MGALTRQQRGALGGHPRARPHRGGTCRSSATSIRHRGPSAHLATPIRRPSFRRHAGSEAQVTVASTKRGPFPRPFFLDADTASSWRDAHRDPVPAAGRTERLVEMARRRDYALVGCRLVTLDASGAAAGAVPCAGRPSPSAGAPRTPRGQAPRRRARRGRSRRRGHEPIVGLHASADFRRKLARHFARHHRDRASAPEVPDHARTFSSPERQRHRHESRGTAMALATSPQCWPHRHHIGCEHGVCGNCTVLSTRDPRSCLMRRSALTAPRS